MKKGSISVSHPYYQEVLVSELKSINAISCGERSPKGLGVYALLRVALGCSSGRRSRLVCSLGKPFVSVSHRSSAKLVPKRHRVVLAGGLAQI